MSRAMLMPVAVLLAAGAVLLGPGEQASVSPTVDRLPQGQVQVDVARFGN